VLPGPEKHSRPHSPKTTAIFEAFTAKKLNFWGGILPFFFISALHFWIKHYTNFLNLTNLYRSTLLLLTATFTPTNFSPQIIFLYGLF
jgi:hypothetical protein